MSEIDKEKIAAIAALLLHINNQDDKFNHGRKNSNVWAYEHRRKLMGLKGIRETKNSRTTWR
ncbi:MAG: hypothetical protein CMB64_02605 [Euryarchaeota archaeon]|nr:hypothetical protein [Euryarchaeota archaeon]|tara:strand:+ start:224 stop:409 length:186 start_codon:yes stop_codon:yes gene_type:complete